MSQAPALASRAHARNEKFSGPKTSIGLIISL
ncbi:MAG: hypothetical protein CFH42_00055 [Alphaproteobacteria bacterium MarineAlpha12_Bin1]|nr:MAG: hypothetical protein CFH42_00055 [Alphaproteobacteria bacterium MarineAlpha12_Bin1]